MRGEATGTRRRGPVQRLGASDIMRKADSDGNGGVDIGEFHALFLPPAGSYLETVCACAFVCVFIYVYMCVCIMWNLGGDIYPLCASCR
jgi:hypothetical protein